MHTKLAILTCVLWSPVLAQSGGARAKTLFELLPPSAITASAVDRAGNVYIAGLISQDVLPVTPNAFQPTFVSVLCPSFAFPGGLCAHAFVAKIGADGATLIYATYLEGGTGADAATAIAVDAAGDAYVSGTTTSVDFPLTPGPYQRAPGEGFVAKLNPDGTALLASTYAGGVSPASIALDSAGNAFITGTTTAKPFAATAGAFQATPQGDSDAFVLKLDSTLRTAAYGTFLGGGYGDRGRAIAVDAQGNAYVTGSTITPPPNGSSVQVFPVTDGAYSNRALGGDIFVVKLSPDGSRLIFSSVLGGSVDESGEAIAVDAAGSVYVAGATSSTDLPIPTIDLPGPATLYRTPDAGFALKLSAGGAFRYLSYLPGPPNVVPRLFQIALNGDRLLVRSYSAHLVTTTPDSSAPCRPVDDLTADTINQEFVQELTSSGIAVDYGAYLHHTVALTGNAAFTVSTASSLLLDRQAFTPVPSGTATCVANAATYLSGPIAPGELVSIFGSGIGPAAAVIGGVDQAGTLSTALGGVVVRINGQPAPLLYVSDKQINAVIPFEVAGADSLSVQVVKDGREQNTLHSLVAGAVPAIFGIVNQDGTVNSQSSPAFLGSTVSLFGTGAGLMQPGAATGSIGMGNTRIAANVSAILRSPTAGIGGSSPFVPLDVAYAGDAPFEVQGVVQINLRLPVGFPPGSPSFLYAIYVTIGDAVTPATPIWLRQRLD